MSKEISQPLFNKRIAFAAIKCYPHSQKGALAMTIDLIEEQITKLHLSEVAKQRFGDMVKAVVDVEKGIMTIGGELHSDEEALLIEQGSRQQDLWGINLYPEKSGDDFIEFDSMINIRPSHGNRSRDVADPLVRQKIKDIINLLVGE
jgi:hypothetical protein